MMNAFCKCTMYKDCIQLFENIKNINWKLQPDVMCYANVLKACMEGTSYYSGVKIHETLKQKCNMSILNDPIVQAGLINFYGKFVNYEFTQQTHIHKLIIHMIFRYFIFFIFF